MRARCIPRLFFLHSFNLRAFNWPSQFCVLVILTEYAWPSIRAYMLINLPQFISATLLVSLAHGLSRDATPGHLSTPSRLSSPAASPSNFVLRYVFSRTLISQGGREDHNAYCADNLNSALFENGVEISPNPSECTTSAQIPCSGDASQLCGGSNILLVYGRYFGLVLCMEKCKDDGCLWCKYRNILVKTSSTVPTLFSMSVHVRAFSIIFRIFNMFVKIFYHFMCICGPMKLVKYSTVGFIAGGKNGMVCTQCRGLLLG